MHDDATDPLFASPYLDIDEWRDTPVRHRYVHGGFTGTDTRFSLYFPPAADYRGRFFQHITPVPDSENLAPGAVGQEDKIGFAFSCGAYFLETNGGGAPATPGDPAADPTVTAYRANAAAATHSREVAIRLYGAHRAYGYAYGGSGGGYRTIGAAESTEGVWDGFVPYVIGSPMAIPNVFSARMHAQRVLRDRLDAIADAVDAGSARAIGSGLSAEEAGALREVTRMGFPVRSWFGHRTMGFHAFGTLYPHIVTVDPGYFEDYWTVPGYLGADPAASVHRDRVRYRCRTSGALTSAQAAAGGVPGHRAPGTPRGGVDEAFRGDGTGTDAIVAVGVAGSPIEPPVGGADLVVISGAAAGARATVSGFHGDIAVLDTPDSGALTGLEPGDTVEIDNSAFLAAQTYHRHQVPAEGYPVWDQFRDAAGNPRYPQRPLLLGPLFTAAASGHLPTGRFAGKMIVVSCLLDREAFPWQADWYRDRVREHHGADADEHFRLWFVDHALHGDDEIQEHPTRTVSYLGVLHEALRQVSAWVETGRAPAAGTRYAVEDGQVHVPAHAADRLGVQPVVTLTADGAQRAEITAGRCVRFEVVAETPPGSGLIVALAWDFDGTGAFTDTAEFDPAAAVTIAREHVFTDPGTHFVTVRVSAHPDGDSTTPYARMDNVARVRVVVAPS
ncbi:hypothetical protein [Nocardia sp. NPDC024068]|uniref:hypothetical protein n=1 Tax=Nocardia sp. NPDC024068 TaxID=3157197 RepID=UPI0033F01959